MSKKKIVIFPKNFIFPKNVFFSKMMESSWRAFWRDNFMNPDFQHFPSGLPADSQQTPSRFPVDSQETPSRL